MNLKNIIPFLLLLVVAALQATFLDYFRFFGTKPDLLLASVIVLSLDAGWLKAVFFGLLAGLLKDSLGAGIIGINVFLFICAALIVKELARKISVDNNYVLLLLTCIAVLITGILKKALVWPLAGLQMPWFQFLRIILLEMLYASFCAPLLLLSLKKIYRQFRLV